MGVNAATGPHVVVNAHLLSGQPTYRSAGVYQYMLHLLRHLADGDESLRYSVLVGAGAPPLDSPARRVESRWSTSRPAARVVWEQLAQPSELRRIGADLVHGPAFVIPLAAGCPSVVTIHDLSFLRFPKLFRPANRLYLTVLTRLSAGRAKRLIAVSAHAAAETTRLLGVPADKIDIVYHGVDPHFRPLAADEVAAFRARKKLPERFVLHVGTLEPRKNHIRLVEAFAQVRETGTALVLAGARGWLYDELFRKVEALGLSKDVVFYGYASSEELPLLYNAAAALAYPSLYEGFGLPVIEAQACGTPVLTSNVSSLPEAAGDAALLVDPEDTDALAAGLNLLLSDDSQRQQLSERGLAHAAQFSWLRSARETAGTYRSALGEGGQS
ncbi:MAG: glycosyltransferase family 1 protein [Anaerolineales bacterium]|nr:MAG: glycosyltransferase family 1 protein [Anaerolineales bacterium]